MAGRKVMAATGSFPRALWIKIHRATGGDAFWVAGFWVDGFWVDDFWVPS